MRFFFNLLGGAPQPETPVAATLPIPPTFEPPPLQAILRQDEADPPAEDTPQPPTFPISLGDLFTVIEYTDAEGEQTRRRVTLRSIGLGTYGLMLNAVCHERRKFRTFRADRVTAVIDANGEVITFQQFCEQALGFTPTMAAVDTQHIIEARKLRDQLRPGLSILVAAARADGHQHINELDAIQLYAEREVLALYAAGKIATRPSIETLEQLCALVETMNPQQSSLIGHVLRVCDWDNDRIARLAKALGTVIRADGVIADQEHDFLELINGMAADRHQRVVDQFAAAGFTLDPSLVTHEMFGSLSH